ncbi:hypothetical protein ScPMuIL_003803 [Solemya velum]
MVICSPEIYPDKRAINFFPPHSQHDADQEVPSHEAADTVDADTEVPSNEATNTVEADTEVPSNEATHTVEADTEVPSNEAADTVDADTEVPSNKAAQDIVAVSINALKGCLKLPKIHVTNTCENCRKLMVKPTWTFSENRHFATIPEKSIPNIEQTAASDPPFSGSIPVDQLEISYTRGSGPGGQHVNKVNTKVEIRFHIPSADWLPDWIKPRLTELAAGKINKSGYLIVKSDKTRKQILNQADCMEKIRRLVFTASKKPNEPTEEDLQLKAKRIARAQREVLRLKRDHSLKKQNRQSPGAYDV